VAIARALVNQPRVLLLDEPLGALDLKLREQMQFELKKLQQDLGITFIFVTHDQGEALSMSDRVAVFNNGKIEQVDAPRDLYLRPRTPFVAGFVARRQLAGLFAKDAHRTAGELFKPGYQPQAGRFTGAGRPQHREKLSVIDGQADAVNRPNVTVDPRDIIKLNGISHASPLTISGRP